MQLAATNYVFEIMVHSFSNDNHLDANNDVCDNSIFCTGDSCEECDNQFTFCLRHYGGPQNDDTSFCPLGSTQTSDAIVFSSLTSLVSSVPNLIVYTGNSWPV